MKFLLLQSCSVQSSLGSKMFPWVSEVHRGPKLWIRSLAPHLAVQKYDFQTQISVYSKNFPISKIQVHGSNHICWWWLHAKNHTHSMKNEEFEDLVNMPQNGLFWGCKLRFAAATPWKGIGPKLLCLKTYPNTSIQMKIVIAETLIYHFPPTVCLSCECWLKTF